MNAQDTNATMAVFLDLENIALGAHDAHYPPFSIQKVLERLLLKGHIVVKKAYCDFDRYKAFKRDLHEAAFELIEIPHVRQSGKNSRRHPHGGGCAGPVLHQGPRGYLRHHQRRLGLLAAGEQAAGERQDGHRRGGEELHLRPVHQQLRRVHLLRRPGAGRAVQGAAARHGQRRSAAKPAEGENKGPSLEKAFDLVVETLEAITEEREEDEPIWGSMIKQAIKRRNPGFNERAYGFRSFNDLLLEAQKRGLLKLEADEKSGGYTVRAVE